MALILCVLILLGCTHGQRQAANTVARINNGVVFYYMQDVVYHDSFWHHSFAIDYVKTNELDSRIRMPNCNLSMWACEDIQGTIQTIRRQKARSINRIKQLGKGFAYLIL